MYCYCPHLKQLKTEARKTATATTTDCNGSSKLVETSAHAHDSRQPPAGVLEPTPSLPTIQKVKITSKDLTKDKGLQSDSTRNQQDKGHSSRTGMHMDGCDPGDGKHMKENKLCFLCEDFTANVRFEPCGHTTMCSQCAERVKKCPICRVSH